jgi:hypothetical protein
MDLDSRIQKMKNVIEKDDIKYPVTEFDPDGTFVDASLFPDGLTNTKYEQIKEGVVQRDMKKIQKQKEVTANNKKFTSQLNENDKFQEFERKQQMTEKNKQNALQTQLESDPQPEPEPEPEPVDISTYKCTALKEITNHLWENKDKKEYTELIIDLLYSISNSEDIEKIKKIVKMYRTQTGQGKRKKKNTKKRGGKRVNKKRVNKKKKSKTKKKK